VTGSWRSPTRSVESCLAWQCSKSYSYKSVTVCHFTWLIGKSSLVRPFGLWCETCQVAALTLTQSSGRLSLIVRSAVTYLEIGKWRVTGHTVLYRLVSSLFRTTMGKRDCAYVEDHHGPLLPFHPGLEISTERDMVVQELEQCITLFFFVSDNIPRVC